MQGKGPGGVWGEKTSLPQMLDNGLKSNTEGVGARRQLLVDLGQEFNVRAAICVHVGKWTELKGLTQGSTEEQGRLCMAMASPSPTLLSPSLIKLLFHCTSTRRPRPKPG